MMMRVAAAAAADTAAEAAADSVVCRPDMEHRNHEQLHHVFDVRHGMCGIKSVRCSAFIRKAELQACLCPPARRR